MGKVCLSLQCPLRVYNTHGNNTLQQIFASESSRPKIIFYMLRKATHAGGYRLLQLFRTYLHTRRDFGSAASLTGTRGKDTARVCVSSQPELTHERGTPTLITTLSEI